MCPAGGHVNVRLVRAALCPGKVAETNTAVTGKFRRIKPRVCVCWLDDVRPCFTTRKQLAAGRAGFWPANRRHFHQNG